MGWRLKRSPRWFFGVFFAPLEDNPLPTSPASRTHRSRPAARLCTPVRLAIALAAVPNSR